MDTCSYCGLTVESPCEDTREVMYCDHALYKEDEMKPNTYPDASFYDTVSKPEHYATWPIEPKEFIMTNDLDYATGNVIKYVMRHAMKNGKEDLEKAKEYIDWLIEEYYSDQ